MTVKPHNLTTVKPHNRKRGSPSSRTGGVVSAYRKFRSLRSLHMRLSIVRPFGDGIGTYTLYTKTADEPLLMVFYKTKGHELHAKRPCFASQNTAFYNTIDYQAVTRTGQTAARTTACKAISGRRLRPAKRALPRREGAKGGLRRYCGKR